MAIVAADEPGQRSTHTRQFMEWPPTNQKTGWNIMDFWRRDGDKLSQNWVLIDLIDAALASKVDLLSNLFES